MPNLKLWLFFLQSLKEYFTKSTDPVFYFQFNGREMLPFSPRWDFEDPQDIPTLMVMFNNSSQKPFNDPLT